VEPYLFYKRQNIQMNGQLTQMQGVALQAVINAGPGAYGVPIRAEYERLMGRAVSIGAMYTVLDRLVQAGFLEDSWSEPTPERGGRKRRLFEPTGLGETALAEFARTTTRLAAHLEGMP
jgi:DNA-binding PadR family transcriptional regulator